MAVRTISYTVSDYALNPSSAQFGGMQNEHNATEVKYTIDDSFLEELKSKGYPLLFRIDFDSPGAGYQPSGNLEPTENNSVSREIPRLMTQYGGQMQTTLVISALKDGKEQFEVLSLPSVIRFTAVQKSDSDLSASLPAYQVYVEGLVQESIDANAESQEILSGIRQDLNSGEFDGFSPIAKVEQTADGAEVTITDRAGTTKAIIKDGAIGPQGIQGPDGPQGKPGEVTYKYLHQNVANALKGNASGVDKLVLTDVSPLPHDIKANVKGDGISPYFTKGELLGNVAEIWDEGIKNHNWQNEDSLGSFSVYQGYVPVSNRTDLYVNISPFSGASAGLLVTDGTVYRTFYACSNAGGEVYCCIQNGKIYISYNGTNILSYDIEENAKIIGISCNGENFEGESLDLYACSISSGVTVTRSGKNLYNQASYPTINEDGLKIWYIPSEDCICIHGERLTSTFNKDVDINPIVVGEFNTSYTLSVENIGGEIINPNKRYANTYLRTKENLENDTVLSNLLEVRAMQNGATIKATGTLHEPEKYITHIRFYIQTGVRFEYFKIRVQLEKGDVATDYEKYFAPSEHLADANGSLTLPDACSTTILESDTKGVTIEAEYNRDVNKAFAELTKAIISLGGNV